MNDNNGKITVYVNLKSKLLFLSIVRMALSRIPCIYIHDTYIKEYVHI